MIRTIEALQNEEQGTFHSDEYRLGWVYEAVSPQKEKYQISAVYVKDLPPRPEIAITKEGDPLDPLRLPHGSAMGKDEETIKSSLSEIAEKCKFLIEKGVSRQDVMKWLDEIEDDD